MKQLGVLTVLVAATVACPCLAQERPLPVDEEAIVREMQELVDRTGELTEADRAKCERLFHKGIRLHDEHKYAEAIELHHGVVEVDQGPDDILLNP